MERPSSPRTDDPKASPQAGVLTAEALLEALPAPAYVKDRACRYIAANQRFLDEVLGKPLSELIGTTDQATKPEDDDQQAREYQILKSGEPHCSNTVTHCADGLDRTYYVVKTAISQAQEPVAVLAMMLDDRVFKGTEAMTQHLQKAIHQLHETVVITDAEAKIIYVNPAFTRVTGYSSEEALGQTPRILQSKQHPPSFYEEMWACLAAGEVWHGVIINRHKSGTLFEEEVSISPVRNPQGTVTHFVAVKRDVTQERRLTEDLLRKQRLDTIGRLAGGVAHEINTPVQFANDNLRFVKDSVRTIGTALSRMRTALSLPHADLKQVILDAIAEADLDFVLGELPEACTQAIDGLTRVGGIVRALQSFTPKDAVNQEVIEVSQLAHDVVRVGRRGLEGDVSIDFEDAAEEAIIFGSRADLSHALLHLLHNAQAAVQANKGATERHIQVTVTQDGCFARIQVQDTGIGIPPDGIERIFDPFYTTSSLRRLGSGLATVHRIAREHDGGIEVQSQEGKGSTFTLRLPLLTDRPFDIDEF